MAVRVWDMTAPENMRAYNPSFTQYPGGYADERAYFASELGDFDDKEKRATADSFVERVREHNEKKWKHASAMMNQPVPAPSNSVMAFVQKHSKRLTGKKKGR